LSGPYFAEDIEVLPGDASAIAVSRKYSGISPRHAGVGVYDSGVPRANVTDGHTGSNVIAFGQSANTLYGYNTETTESGLRTMSVDATGVTVLDVTQNLIQSSSADIEFSDGYLYSSNGRVIDAATRILDGTFAINSFGALVEPDAAAGRVFFLEAVDFNTSWQLKAFNSGTLGLINSEPVSNVKGFPSSLIRWGSHGLAFRTSEKQIFLVTTALVQKF